MHKYMRAIGFSKCRTRQDIQAVLDRAISDVSETQLVQYQDGAIRQQIFAETGRGIGLSVCGELNEMDELEREYYFPYLKSTCISSQAPCQIQRHAEKESYAGICEEFKLGVSLIFYLRNGVEYVRRLLDPYRRSQISSVMLSGLSLEGRILLPVEKTEKQRETVKAAARTRTARLEAAKKGDPIAMDSLANEDMDLYNFVLSHVRREDIYSIVDSYFMPFGVECDQYSILGEIAEVETVTNLWTNEEIYVLMVECNDLLLQVGIHKDDLLGEPKIGRRFKGSLWLQGEVNFME